MTDKLAIWLSGGSLLVSLASFGLAAMAKRQAQKTATLGLRTEAINHVREALHDLIVDKVVRAEAPIIDIDGLLAAGAMPDGTVKAKTADSIRKALNLSHLVFSSRVRKELDRAYAAAYRLREIRQITDQDVRDIVALREDLQTLLAHMNQEATLIGWSAPWRWLRSSA
jgi:hypothetical protein